MIMPTLKNAFFQGKPHKNYHTFAMFDPDNIGQYNYTPQD